MSLKKKTIEAIDKILEKMQVLASAKVEEDSVISVSIEGEDAAILIGRDGRTLDALQFLLGIIVNKGRDEDRVRVVVDVEGYRKKREENIEHLALSLAEEVEQTNKPVNMEPANAFERRIVHMVLRESTSVMTESQGEGLTRHVVIRPL